MFPQGYAPSSNVAALGAFSRFSPALLLMHMIEEVQASREIPAAKARAGDACQEESSAFPVAAESFSASKSLREATPNSKGRKAKRVWQPWGCVPWQRQQQGLAAGQYRGASAPPAPTRARAPPNKERQEQDTVPCVSAKGNNSQIKPCRLQSAPTAYAKNFRLQIEVV